MSPFFPIGEVDIYRTMPTPGENRQRPATADDIVIRMGRDNHDGLVVPLLKRVALERDFTLPEQIGSRDGNWPEGEDSGGKELELHAVTLTNTPNRSLIPRCAAAVPPNESRLSCGRLARRRKSTERTPRARQGMTQRSPLERARPSASSAC